MQSAITWYYSFSSNVDMTGKKTTRSKKKLLRAALRDEHEPAVVANKFYLRKNGLTDSRFDLKSMLSK